MKTFKTIPTMLLAASLILGAATTTKAAQTVGTITDFSKVTVALTVTSNGVPTTKGSTTKFPTVSAKISNATLIALFASWTTNNLSDWQSAGAQLEINWSNPSTYGLVVADKTGTNVLFFADSSNGISNGAVTAFFDVRFYDNYGPYTETDTATTASYTQVYTGDFELLYNNTANLSQTTDLFSDGPNSEKYSESTKPTWSDTESLSVNNSGVTFNSNSNLVQVVGTITATGKGNDANPYLNYPF